MIELNRLTNPGDRAALERVEVLAQSLDGLSIELFVPAQSGLLDPDDHARLVDEVEAEAERCGRAQLLHDVCARVGTSVAERLGNPLRYDPVGRYAMRPSRVEDLAMVELVITDAAAVAVMEDQIAPDTAVRLSTPGRLLLGLPLLEGDSARPTAVPAVPAGEAAVLGPEARGAVLPEPEAAGERRPEAAGEPGADAPTAPAEDAGAPNAADWAAAATGDTRVGGYSPIPMGLRVVIATVAAVVLAPAAVVAGVGTGQTGIGILAGLAVVALCWLAATYNR